MIAAESASGTLASRAAQLFAQFRDGDEATMSDLVTLVTPILWHTARAQRLDHLRGLVHLAASAAPRSGIRP